MTAPNLTARQLEAVDVSRRHVDACVVAGPGSGKTTVLVEYFKRLVEAGVDPARILAITFTEKAAAQMRRRLADAFREDPAIRPKLERAWVSTVHGFCARLLRENPVAAGVDPGFTIAEEREFGRWQQESMAEAMESIFADHPAGVRALIRGLASDRFEAAIVSAYDAMRGAGTRIDGLAAFPAPAGTDLADIAATLGELRACGIADWNAAQKGELAAALDGIARVVAAPGAREALDAVEGFACDLRRLKRGSAACGLVKALRDEQLKRLEYTLVTRLYAQEREMLTEVLRRFDAHLPQAQNPGGRAGFRGPGRVRRGACWRAVRKRARACKRSSITCSWTSCRTPTGSRPGCCGLVRPAGALLRGGRREPVDLRLPPRRAAGVSQFPRRGGGVRRARGRTGGELPQPAGNSARGGNRGGRRGGNRTAAG